MSRRSLRQAVATAASAALLAGGLTVGLGASVAQAAPACALNQSVTARWAGSLNTPYTLAKEIVGDGKVAPGGTVTYITKVSGSSALVNEIRDYPPAGFQLVKARLSVKYVVGDQKWQDVTTSAVVGNGFFGRRRSVERHEPRPGRIRDGARVRFNQRVSSCCRARYSGFRRSRWSSNPAGR